MMSNYRNNLMIQIKQWNVNKLSILSSPLSSSYNNNNNNNNNNSYARSYSSSLPSSSYTKINFNSALCILNLQHKPNYNSQELRDAYFSAAKLCHPDMRKTTSSTKNHDGDDDTLKFLELTQAYEILQEEYKLVWKKGHYNISNKSNKSSNSSSSYIIHQNEEEHFRTACREKLGLDAETVEESKKCPLFREWLKGKTDAALYWKSFLMLHGGFAPMLNDVNVMRLSEGNGEIGGSNITRRRRKRR